MRRPKGVSSLAMASSRTIVGRHRGDTSATLAYRRRKWTCVAAVAFGAVFSSSKGVMAHEVEMSMSDFIAIENAKKQKHPKRVPSDWFQEGFAFPDKRAAEFEALRTDELERSLWKQCAANYKMDRTTAGLPMSRFKVTGWKEPARIRRGDTNPEAFRAMFEETDTPVMIEGTVEADEWKAADWTIESIVQRYPDMLVRVGSGKSTNDDIQITMSQFYKYTVNQVDDDPLYVFDDLVYADENGGRELMTEYTVPDLFEEDIFQLAQGHPNYPAYRWLLLGPKRSGSGIHSDPIGTSAWNTLIHGRKLWFLSPPDTEDQFRAENDTYGEACSWFIDSLPPLREKYRDDVYMVVQHPGETIFVPAFWMHAVLNLDDTVAVTQNFVSMHNFPEAWMLTQESLPDFSKALLQQLVIYHEELALTALEINRDHGLSAWAYTGRQISEDDDFDDDDFETKHEL